MAFDKFCSIDCGKKPFGCLRWGADNLKIIFRAESFAYCDGVYRVFAFSSKNQDKKLLIGVLEPDEDKLSLTKSFSRLDLSSKGIGPDDIDSAEAILCVPRAEDADIWHRESAQKIGLKDQTLLRSIGEKQILVYKENDKTFIAEPVNFADELALAPALSIASFLKINGYLHAVFEIKNGFLEKALNINFLAG